MMKKFSLKLRLLISFLCIASVVWVVSGIMSWFETRDSLDEFFDTYQILMAKQMATADWKNITPKDQINANKIIENLLEDGEEDDEALGFAVFNKEGKMIFNDGENGALFPYNPSPYGFVNQPVGGKKKMWRIVWLKTADNSHTIAVGQEIEYRDEATMEIVAQSLLPWTIGLIFLIIASIWRVSKEFVPLKLIAKNLQKRTAGDLSPILTDNHPQEIEPLLYAINKQFSRIEDMLKRERSFISDSAHELRSPLTALKVQLDVALLSKDDPKARNKALEKLSMGIERSNRLIEQLLALSRLESGTFKVEEELIDWKKLIEDIIAEQENIIKEKNININFTYKNEVPADSGNAVLLSLLVRNLLDNAVRYSPDGGTVFIKIKDRKLSITNSGSKIDNKYLSRLGERFFRPPGQKESGSGLGLSIVEKIAKLHNCFASFRNTSAGFNVTICRQ